MVKAFTRNIHIVLLIQRLLSLVLLGLTPAIAIAETLDVSVDKSRLYEDETLELRVQGETTFSFSLQGLMSLNPQSFPEPELSGLEKDFEILDRNQQYSVRSINGDNRAQITWVYELSPKRTGELAIPAIKFQESVSEPIKINVLPGSGRSGEENPFAFIKTTLDKQSVYLQEQLIFTTKLYLQNSALSGELTDPEPTDAVVEPLGKQTKLYEMVNGQRYEVIQRKFLIFPQKSGELVIPAVRFEGRVVDRNRTKRRFAKAASEMLRVQVKPVPAQFTGGTWLPAMAMELSENWSTPPENLKQGDSVTRTITLTGLGLLGSAIPDINTGTPTGIKVYPEPAQRESSQVPAGAEATVSITEALVAVNSGEINLPEIRVVWWDTLNDQERVTSIPARRISVTASSLSPQSLPVPESQTSDHQVPSGGPAATEPDNTPAKSNQDTVLASTLEQPSAPFWKALSLIFLILWLGTLTWLLVQRRTPKPIESGETNSNPISSRADTSLELKKAFEKGSKSATTRLLQWCSSRDGRTYENLRALHAAYPDQSLLFEALHKYEAAHFGPNPAEHCASDCYRDISQGLDEILKKQSTPAVKTPISHSVERLYPA